MAAAPPALDAEPRTWLGKKWQELKDGLDPGEVIGLEVAVTVFTWLFCGVVFFYVSEKNVDHKFDDMTGNVIFYTIYFCVNVGLGVGSAPMKPSSWFERIGCALFCFAGNCLIVGGVGVYYGASSQRVLKRLAMGDEGEEEHIRRLQLVVRGGGFCGLVLLGMFIAWWTADYDGFADMLTFSVTNLTTSGLLVGKESDLNFSVQAAFFLVGIPYAITFYSEVSGYFWHVADASERRRAQRLARKRSRRHTAGEGTAIADDFKKGDDDARHVTVSTAVLEELEDIAAVAGFLKVDDRHQLRRLQSKGDLAAADEPPPPGVVGVGPRRASNFVADFLLEQRSKIAPGLVQVADLAFALAVWLFLGTAFFYCCQPEWSLVYSFYYAVNVGFGVGSAPKQSTKTYVMLFTCWHCITGSILIVGGISVVFKESTERIRDSVAPVRPPLPGHEDSSSSSDDEKKAEVRSEMLEMLGAFYGVALVAGVAVGRLCGFKTFPTLFEYAVTNMTTAGLLVFNREATDTNSVYFASAVFLLIAIPVGAVFIGELASLAFVSRERAVVKHRLRQSILIRGRPPSPPPGGDDDERPRPPQRRGTTTIDAKYLSFLKESAGRSHQPVDMAGSTVPVVKETP